MDNQQSGQLLTKRQRRELKHQEQENDRAKQIRHKKITTWLVVVGLIIVVGGLLYWVIVASNGNGSGSASAVNPTLGGADAKVVVTEFSDLSCPACAVVAPTVRQLATDYGDQIKIVFNNFDLGHRWSEKSLEAGECALQQNKFWEFSDLVFAKQDEWLEADNAVALLKGYAGQAGLDANQFNSCLDSGSMKSEITKDVAAARAKKINSTPTFFINDQRVIGVKSLQEFKTIIDSELNKLK